MVKISMFDINNEYNFQTCSENQITCTAQIRVTAPGTSLYTREAHSGAVSSHCSRPERPSSIPDSVMGFSSDKEAVAQV